MGLYCASSVQRCVLPVGPSQRLPDGAASACASVSIAFQRRRSSLSTPSRDNSTVPLQALYLLNNSFVHEQAERLAGRLIAESKDVTARIQLATLHCYGRAATDGESRRWQKFIDAYQASLASEGVPAESREQVTWSAVARSLLASNEFFFVD